MFTPRMPAVQAKVAPPQAAAARPLALHGASAVSGLSMRGLAVAVRSSAAFSGAASSAAEPPPLGEVLQKAAKRALGGGIPGMVAMVIQVFSLMWMRTTINYQYRHGGTMFGTLSKLYKEGGIPRFYRGLLPALVQVTAPLFAVSPSSQDACSIQCCGGPVQTR